jgi:hypothetical protein
MKNSLLLILLLSFQIVINNQCINPQKKNTEEAKRIISKINNKVVYIPDSLRYYKLYYQSDSFKFISLYKDLKKVPQYKIITHVNGECGTCIQELNEWAEFIKPFNTKINFVPVVYTSDILYFKETMIPQLKSNYSLYLDTKDDFLHNNELHKYKKIFRTLLLDKNNNPILVGNPIYSKNLKKLYKEEINKRLN